MWMGQICGKRFSGPFLMRIGMAVFIRAHPCPSVVKSVHASGRDRAEIGILNHGWARMGTDGHG
jgi:hypothetical protein